MKGVKCEIKVINGEFFCSVPGKSKNGIYRVDNTLDKQLKHFFPFGIRQIVSVKSKNDDVIIYACVRRKGYKEGSKLKKLSFVFPPKVASIWVTAFEKAVFGGINVK